MKYPFPTHSMEPENPTEGSLPNSAALRYLRPKSQEDWRQFRNLCAWVLFAIAVAPGLLYHQYSLHRMLREDWTSAAATIKDTRTERLQIANWDYGGAVLYEVEMLAKYSVNGAEHEKWIALSEYPHSQSDAQLKAYLLKGKQCFVRWNPAHPDQIVADIH